MAHRALAAKPLGVPLPLGARLLVAVPAPPTPTYVEAVLASRPALYWRLNEPTDARTVVDYSGNGKHGTYTMGRALAAGPLGADPADGSTQFSVQASVSLMTGGFWGAIPARLAISPNLTTMSGTGEGKAVELVMGALREEPQSTSEDVVPSGDTGATVLQLGPSTSTAYTRVRFVAYHSLAGATFVEYLDRANAEDGTSYTFGQVSRNDGNPRHIVCQLEPALERGAIYLQNSLIAVNDRTGFPINGSASGTLVVGAQDANGTFPYQGRLAHVALYPRLLPEFERRRHVEALERPAIAAPIRGGLGTEARTFVAYPSAWTFPASGRIPTGLRAFSVIVVGQASFSINASSRQTIAAAVGSSGATAGGWALRLSPGILQLLVRDDGGGLRVNAVASVNELAPHAYGFVHNPIAPAYRALYLDGVLVGSAATNVTSFGAFPLCVGHRDGIEVWSGGIGGCYLYDGALSALDMRQAMQTALATGF